MRIIACIVTYNPDIRILSESLKILKKWGLITLIVDNFSSNRNLLNNLKNIIDKIILFDRNEGLAKAYNTCCTEARSYNSEWVLFLDQDSLPLIHFNIWQVLHMLKERSNLYKRIGIVSINGITATKAGKLDDNFFLAKYVVGSGMLVNIDVCRKFKFLEELFLYGIDIEYSTRLRRAGYLVLAYKEQGIKYKIGEKIEKYKKYVPKIITVILSKIVHKDLSFYPYYSDPMRYYIMLRNNIYLIVRRRIELSYSKYLPFLLLIMYERLGLKDTVKLTLRALKYGILGRLEEDNKKVFGGTGA